MFKDPIKQDFLKEAKSLDIEIIDRAKREFRRSIRHDKKSS